MSLVLPKGPNRDLSSVAVSCVGTFEVSVTVTPVVKPLNVTCDDVVKPEPVNWIATFVVGVGVCTGVLVGLMLVSVGVLPRTTNGREFVVFAPSRTLIGITAPAATSPVVMDALRLVALLNVVMRALPFHRTVEVAVNPLPWTFRVNAAPGEVVERGEIALMRKLAVPVAGPRLKSHTPRPCVAARNVRDGL